MEFTDSQGNDMGVVVCLLGDVQESVLSEPGSFVVTDTKGRNWYCFPGTEADMNEFPAPTVVKAMAAQQAAHAQGHTHGGTKVAVLRLEGAELSRALGER